MADAKLSLYENRALEIRAIVMCKLQLSTIDPMTMLTFPGQTGLEHPRMPKPKGPPHGATSAMHQLSWGRALQERRLPSV